MSKPLQGQTRPAHLDKLDMRQLEQFLAVVDQGSFRGAARVLNVAQPAVSRNVRNLEATLGVKLLLRNRQGVTLTHGGSTLAEGARRLRSEATNIATRTRLADRGEIGELRIAYTDFAIAGTLPRVIKAFRQRHPSVSLRFIPLVTGEQIEALRLGEIDVAFLTGPLRREGLESRVVQTDLLVCFVPESHPLAQRRTVRLAELAEENFVFGEHPGWAHFLSHINALCQRHGFLPTIVQEARDSSAILGLVSAGIGISLSIERAGRRPDGFVCLGLEDLQYRIETLVARRTDSDNPLVDNLFAVAAEIVPLADKAPEALGRP